MVLSLYENGLGASWSFGQVLPPFLVLLPVHTLVASVADAHLEARKGRFSGTSSSSWCDDRDVREPSIQVPQKCYTS